MRELKTARLLAGPWVSYRSLHAPEWFRRLNGDVTSCHSCPSVRPSSRSAAQPSVTAGPGAVQPLRASSLGILRQRVAGLASVPSGAAGGFLQPPQSHFNPVSSARAELGWTGRVPQPAGGNASLIRISGGKRWRRHVRQHALQVVDEQRLSPSSEKPFSSSRSRSRHHARDALAQLLAGRQQPRPSDADARHRRNGSSSSYVAD